MRFVTLYETRSCADAAVSCAVLALVLLFAGACRSTERAGAAGGAPPAPAAASATSKVPDRLAPGAARALAFADPRDAETVDHMIRAQQKRAQAIATNTDQLILLGRFWIRKARETVQPRYYLNARAAADLVFEREPENRLAKNLVATTLLNEHRFADAATLARSVLARDAEDLEALGVLADALIDLGRYAEAMSFVDRQNDLKPGLPGYARAAHLKWLRGDADVAVEAYRLAIRSGNDPTHPEPRCWALTQAAQVFFLRGDYSGADAGYAAALKDCKNYVPALIGSGRAAVALGDPARAVRSLDVAFKLQRTPETAWRLGDARMAAGDRDGAERAYAEVMSTPADEDPRTVAQFLATRDKDPERAVRLARAELERRPGIYTSDALAWALHRAGKTAEARAHATAALRLGTPDPTLLFHAGAIEIASGNAHKGHALVERALALSPRFDPTEAEAARRLLESRPPATAAR
jgi:tetratricopeptide (TPR) repeat protein